MTTKPTPDLDALAAIAREAGGLALSLQRGGVRTWMKEGQDGRLTSPVTEADMALDRLLHDKLLRLLPEAGWLSEETADDPARLARERVWIVDPIDGTRAFMAGQPEWAVSIALVENGMPVLGVLEAPALGITYAGRHGGGASANGHRLKGHSDTGLASARVAGPKPMIEKLARGAGPLASQPRVPSLALRLARVADGTLDIAFAAGHAHDWDLAAADLLLHEAGAVLAGLDGRRPAYNQRRPLHGPLFASSAARARSIVALMGTTMDDH
jgi:myo-inositol-1(or 4)-monophosphatase